MLSWPRLAVMSLWTVAAVALPEGGERSFRRAMAYVEHGMKALEKGNLTRAKADFDRAVAAAPDLPDGHVGLGHVAMRERRFEDALREYRACENGYRSMTLFREQMENERYARSRNELQRLRSALVTLQEEARRTQANNGPTSGSTEGLTGIEQERDEVERRIRELESLSPPSPAAADQPPAEVFFFEGNALFNLKRIDEAMAAWETASRRDPELAMVQNNLAVAYWMKGRLADARAAMERAEALGFKVDAGFRAELEKAARP